jgi:hypothetical protein
MLPIVVTRFLAAACCACMILALASCGKPGEIIGGGSDDSSSGTNPSIPSAATKNTTRASGSTPVSIAAAASRAVYPGTNRNQHPLSIVLADTNQWQATIAGAALMAAPLHAPMLLSSAGALPAETQTALDALAPTGTGSNGPQIIRLGSAPQTTLRTKSIDGGDPYTLAANIDSYKARITGRWSSSIVIASAESPAMAMPAAAWAAKSGDAVLFTGRDQLPPATAAAIKAHGKPRLYILGPTSAISPAVATALRGLGSVTRIAGNSPSANSVAFARFRDKSFGWGVVDPGHGMVFANPAQAATAGAAAPLSASGSYGPLLLVGNDGSLPNGVRSYLSDIRPGYSSDPVRGVYNHAWMIGDTSAVSDQTQTTIDSLLEIAPITNAAAAR